MKYFDNWHCWYFCPCLMTSCSNELLFIRNAWECSPSLWKFAKRRDCHFTLISLYVCVIDMPSLSYIRPSASSSQSSLLYKLIKKKHKQQWQCVKEQNRRNTEIHYKIVLVCSYCVLLFFKSIFNDIIHTHSKFSNLYYKS